MQSGYTDQEFAFVNLLYNVVDPQKGLGNGSIFAERVFSNQLSVPLANAADAPPSALIRIVAPDSSAAGFVARRMRSLVRKPGVTFKGDNRRPVFAPSNAPEELLVGFAGEWLVPSLDVGYTRVTSTLVRCRLDGESRAGRHTLLFDESLGVARLEIRLDKFFDGEPTQRSNDEEKLAELPKPSSINLVVDSAVVLTVLPSAEDKTERSCMLLAVRYASMLVCAISTLRVVCALLSAKNTAVERSGVEQATTLLAETLAKLGETFAFRVPADSRYTDIGASLLTQLSTSTVLSRNTITPLRRMHDNQQVQRESELAEALLTRQWVQAMSALTKGLPADQVGEEGVATPQTVEQAVPSIARAASAQAAMLLLLADYPREVDAYARRLYTALQSRNNALFTRDTLAQLGPLTATLEACAEVDEAVAVARALGPESADETKIGIVYMLAKEASNQSVALTTTSQETAAQLTRQLRLVTICPGVAGDAAVQSLFASVKAFVEDDRLHLEEPGGAYSTRSLRERVFVSLGAAASTLVARILQQSSLAVQVSTLLRDSVGNALRVTVPDDETDAIKRIYDDIKATLTKVQSAVAGRGAPPVDAVYRAQNLLETLVAKIQTAAFEGKPADFTPQISRSKFFVQQNEAQRALLYARSLRAYYANPTSQEALTALEGAADIVPEDLASIDLQARKTRERLNAAIDASLNETLDKAAKEMPESIKPNFAEFRASILAIRSSLESKQFVLRIASQLRTFRKLVQQSVFSATDRGAVTEPADPQASDKFKSFADAMGYMLAVGYISRVELELVAFASDDAASSDREIVESVAAAERRLARAAAAKLVEVTEYLDTDRLGAADALPLNREFRQWVGVLQSIVANNGEGGYVPIVSRDTFATLKQQSRKQDLTQEALENIVRYARSQTEYFRNAVQRAPPTFDLALLRVRQLTDEEKQSIATTLQPLLVLLERSNAAFADHPTQANAESITRVATTLIGYKDAVGDLARLAQLRNIKELCDVYLATLARNNEPAYSAEFETQIKTVVNLRNTCADLLVRLAGETREDPVKVPTVAWLDLTLAPFAPEDYTVFDAALPTAALFGALLDAAERQSAQKVLRTSTSLAQLREAVNQLVDDDGSTEIYKGFARRFVDTGANLIEALKQLGTAINLALQIPKRDEGALVGALLQVDRARNEMLAAQRRFRDAVAAPSPLAGSAAATAWQERVLRENIKVAQLLGQQSAAEQKNLEVIVAKARVADLQELKEAATLIGDQLKEQLKEIETSAKDAVKSIGDASGLRDKVARLKQQATDIINGVNAGEAAAIPLSALIKEAQAIQAQVLAESDRIDQLGVALKEAQKLVTDARSLTAKGNLLNNTVATSITDAAATEKLVAAKVPALEAAVASLRALSTRLDQELAKVPASQKQLAKKVADLEQATNTEALQERLTKASEKVGGLTQKSTENLRIANDLAAQATAATTGLVRALEIVEKTPTPEDLEQRNLLANEKVTRLEEINELYTGLPARVDSVAAAKKKLDAVETDLKKLPTPEDLEKLVKEAVDTSAALQIAAIKIDTLDARKLVREVKKAQETAKQVEKLPDASDLESQVDAALEKREAFAKTLEASKTLEQAFGSENLAKFQKTQKLLERIGKVSAPEDIVKQVADAKEKVDRIKEATGTDLAAIQLALDTAVARQNDINGINRKLADVEQNEAGLIDTLKTRQETIATSIAAIDQAAALLEQRVSIDGNRSTLSRAIGRINLQLDQDTRLISRASAATQRAAAIAKLAAELDDQTKKILEQLPAAPAPSIESAFAKLSADVQAAFATFSSVVRSYNLQPPPLQFVVAVPPPPVSTTTVVSGKNDDDDDDDKSPRESKKKRRADSAVAEPAVAEPAVAPAKNAPQQQKSSAQKRKQELDAPTQDEREGIVRRASAIGDDVRATWGENTSETLPQEIILSSGQILSALDNIDDATDDAAVITAAKENLIRLEKSFKYLKAQELVLGAQTEREGFAKNYIGEETGKVRLAFQNIETAIENATLAAALDENYEEYMQRARQALTAAKASFKKRLAGKP